jgi:hypothetical protein
MKSSQKSGATHVVTRSPNELASERLRRNPVISHSGHGFQRAIANEKVLSSEKIGLVQQTIRDRTRENSGMMLWDNQLLFGRSPGNRSSTEKGDSEGE